MLDLEMLRALQAEGYPVGPGIIGENLTVSCVHVQRMSPGDRLCFDGGPVLELTEARKPCFVLDKIHPALKEAVVGRCGYLARVASSGHVFPGQRVAVVGESGS
jgi:MOSC domain-containing protein YiiM